LGKRVIAVFATAALLAALGCSTPTPTAGFWWDDDVFGLSAPAAEALGGVLTGAELESIKRTSRAELEHAFDGMKIRISDDHQAFWRVEVVHSLRARGPLPNSGESLSFGWLGGSGAVSFDLVSLKAVAYAPKDAPRQAIVDGSGRGIGRVAAHEFAHQMLNTEAAHNKDDDNSYEFPSPDRASQYYGELHWSTARPLLDKKLR